MSAAVKAAVCPDHRLLPDLRLPMALLVAGACLPGFAQETSATLLPRVDSATPTERYDLLERIDIKVWRNTAPPPTAVNLVQQNHLINGYGVRMEMALTPVRRAGVVAEKGFVGLQLESGARITLKRNGGKPMMYYRDKF